MMKPIIILKKEVGFWITEQFEADGVTPSARLVDLFGTHKIPTAWNIAAPAETVLSELRKLNPGSDVRLFAGQRRQVMPPSESIGADMWTQDLVRSNQWGEHE